MGLTYYFRYRINKGTVPAPVVVALFISLIFSPGDATAAQPPATGPALGPSSYRLIGTVKSAAFAGAVFVDAAGVQTFYRLSEQLPDGSQIIKVQDDSILLKRADGSTYELFIARDTKPATQNTPPTSTPPLVSSPHETPEVSSVKVAPAEPATSIAPAASSPSDISDVPAGAVADTPLTNVAPDAPPVALPKPILDQIERQKRTPQSHSEN